MRRSGWWRAPIVSCLLIDGDRSNRRPVAGSALDVISFSFTFFDASSRTGRHAGDPALHLLQRDPVRASRLADLDVERRVPAHLLNPWIVAESCDGQDNGFVQRLGFDVDAVAMPRMSLKLTVQARSATENIE